MGKVSGFRTAIAGGLLLFLSGATAFASSIFLPPRQGPVGDKHRPAVEAIDAQREIGDGQLWKIYIRASDPDGDLDKIYVTFSQLGVGAYSPELLVQKNTMKSLKGYILVWAKLEGGGTTGDILGNVEVRAEDRAGNMSEPKSFEFKLVQFGGEDRFHPPGEFDAGNNLGQAGFPLQTETDIAKGS